LISVRDDQRLLDIGARNARPDFRNYLSSKATSTSSGHENSCESHVSCADMVDCQEITQMKPMRELIKLHAKRSQFID